MGSDPNCFRQCNPSSPHGAEHHYRWDAQGRLLAYRDPLGQSTQWRYNASGDISERTDPQGVMSAVRISFLAEFQPRFFKVQPLGAGY